TGEQINLGADTNRNQFTGQYFSGRQTPSTALSLAEAALRAGSSKHTDDSVTGSPHLLPDSWVQQPSGTTLRTKGDERILKGDERILEAAKQKEAEKRHEAGKRQREGIEQGLQKSVSALLRKALDSLANEYQRKLFWQEVIQSDNQVMQF